MSYGADLRKWRLNKMMSQRQLAEVLGITHRTVHNVERGKHRPSYDTQLRIKALKRRFMKATRI